MEDDEEHLVRSMALVRPILNQIADKWSIMILIFLCEKPQRFNNIRKRLVGITQKALTQTLRRLERNGLVTRKVIPVSPIAVEYSITPLGRTLQGPFTAIYTWAAEHQSELETANAVFDRQ